MSNNNINNKNNLNNNFKNHNKNYNTTLIIFAIIIITLIIIFLFFKNKSNSFNINSLIDSSKVQRIQANKDINENNNNSQSTENTSEQQKANVETANTSNQPTEQQISTFSTPLKSKKSNRLTNIRITCAAINNHIVYPNETFSFCTTVGKPSKEKGYKLAQSYSSTGKTIKTLGGGNCQVCTTLYNAVLNVPNLQVIERHEHSKSVNYVEKGKDATCAYNYLDLKFKNNLTNPIKIYSSTDDKNVTVSIIEIKNQ